jgi:hypothetical protein
MSRRKPLPGQLSLLHLPAVSLASPEPTPAPKPAEPEPAFAILQPECFRDGRFYLPPGIQARTASKHWFCVVHPDGSYRDALAVLYTMYDSDEQPVAVLDCPILKRRWELKSNWHGDVFNPFMAAVNAYAAETLGLSPEAVRDLSYVTMAWSGEMREDLRDVGHMGNVRPRVRSEELKEAVNG